MTATTFLTISDDLLSIADAAATHFRDLGYRISVEPSDIEFPYRPAFVAKRSPVRIIVEVTSTIVTGRVEQWVRYGRSCSRDTQLALFLPRDTQVPETIQAVLVERGVGLYRSDGADTYEALAPRDLALNVQLPEIRGLPASHRRLLGPVYEKFQRGDWREGFQEACLVLETEAREYLKKGLRSGRITVLDARGRPRNPTLRQVNRMTLGQLGVKFSMIQNQNYADSAIAGIISEINKDRVLVVHSKRKTGTEKRLRENVGRYMWTVVNCLRLFK